MRMGRLYDQPGATEIISRKGAKAQRKGIKRFRISCVFLCAFAPLREIISIRLCHEAATLY
jgi:hypothetical protein